MIGRVSSARPFPFSPFGVRRKYRDRGEKWGNLYASSSPLLLLLPFFFTATTTTLGRDGFLLFSPRLLLFYDTSQRSLLLLSPPLLFCYLSPSARKMKDTSFGLWSHDSTSLSGFYACFLLFLSFPPWMAVDHARQQFPTKCLMNPRAGGSSLYLCRSLRRHGGGLGRRLGASEGWVPEGSRNHKVTQSPNFSSSNSSSSCDGELDRRGPSKHCRRIFSLSLSPPLG